MDNSLLHNHLYSWYGSNHRALPWRETDDGYAIWLSEIILQQTRVRQGLDYYLRFISRWPTVGELALASEDAVLRAWQGLGYYSRARHLHEAAKMIVERGWEPFPTRYDDIRSLPGVGDYTAGAICSFAYNQAYPAMDGNVYRVVARLKDIDEPFDTSAGKKLFHRELEEMLDRAHPRLFNSAIMEFGALWCTPVLGDHCADCPLQSVCAGYSHGTAEILPVRKPRVALRDRWLKYHIYLCKQEGEIYTLIHQRKEKDIWLHLYEFVGEEESRVKSQESRVKSQESRAKSAYECTHVLSHQRVHARFYIHKVAELPDINDSIRVRWAELDEYALSRLTLKALEHLFPHDEVR